FRRVSCKDTVLFRGMGRKSIIVPLSSSPIRVRIALDPRGAAALLPLRSGGHRVTPERRQTVNEILERALACAVDERPRVLDAACPADAQLRTAVETLLEPALASGESTLALPADAPQTDATVATERFTRDGRATPTDARRCARCGAVYGVGERV